jgi:aldehyde:ferredoxin oxidoreductase
MGLGLATSNRGACHLRGYTFASEVAGIPYPTNPQAWEGKAELLKYMQDLHAVSDSLNICKFSAFAESPDDYVAQYSSVVGVKLDADQLMTIGERIYNLERHYNNLAGIGEGSDTLPERFLTEPSTGGGSEGQVCELELMLEEYYAARGWVNGVLPSEKLEALAIP